MPIFNPKKLFSYPTAPGVYLMLNAKKEVLYIGKAKNLRQRLKQYFTKGGDERPQIPYLISQVVTIEVVVVSSEQEALLLENNLIKQHQPKYNVLLKDDKSYLSLRLNTQKEWADFELVRFKEEPKGEGLLFGPYTSAYAARETVELLKRLFPLRTCSDRELSIRVRPCILHQMGKCIAPCVNNCTKEEYQELVNGLIRFLKGDAKEILKALKRDMEAASKEMLFEKAGALLKKMRAIEKTLSRQSVECFATGDRDVIGLYREASEGVVVNLIFRKGKLIDKVTISFANSLEGDEDLLQSLLLQYYQKGIGLPKELLLPVEVTSLKELEKLLIDQILCKGPKLLIPKRGERLKLIEMARKNAVEFFRRERSEKERTVGLLTTMQEKLCLRNYPRLIECYDNSNISGSGAVMVKVAYYEGSSCKKEYRKYLLKTANGQDDYGMMHEALSRRFHRALREGGKLPDLLIVDGGVGQLNIARKILDELDITTVDLIALAKEAARHDKGLSAERVFLPGRKDAVSLHRHSKLLFFLQNIRDEAHRFAITFHRKRMGKKITQSILNDIKGIGPKKRTILLKKFGSVKRVREASIEKISSIKGLTKRDAQVIEAFFRQNQN